MKAAIYGAYGLPEVLQIQEIEKPSPKDHEVLIKIHATGVSSGDCRLRRAEPKAVRLFFGLFRPRIKVLGGVLSGEIEAVGKAVTKYKVGDSVFGATDMSFGTYAEYKCLPETAALALKPENITHEEAATIPFGGATALVFLKKANIQKGQKVLIYGASGAVGSAAVQIAKYMGAVVTGVCSTKNIDLVKSIGADHVIDYTQEDFSKNGERYDVVMETVAKTPVAMGLAAVKKNGILILSASMFLQTLQGIWASMTGSKKVLSGVAHCKVAEMAFLKKMIEEAQFKPVLDRTYPLHQIAEAHRYVDAGHKKGNVAIKIF